MKKILLTVFLLLAFAVSLRAQTRVGIGAGFFFEKVDMLGMSSNLPVIRPFVQIDHYFTYRFAFHTGVGYYKVGYSTLGHEGSLLMYGKTVPLDQVNNRWQQSMLSVPLGVRIGPQTYPYNLTFGADLNFTLKSKLWDLHGTSNTTDYFVTDITKTVRPLNVTPFVMITYMIGPVTFNLRYMFFMGNWYSAEAALLADRNAKASGAHWRSWYSTYADLLQLYPGLEMNVTYRIR
jgi:hypothetical protein